MWLGDRRREGRARATAMTERVACSCDEPKGHNSKAPHTTHTHTHTHTPQGSGAHGKRRAVSPAAAAIASCSCMSATSGQKTTMGPSAAQAGSIYSRLLPPPVGITARASSPPAQCARTASCRGRNETRPKRERSHHSGEPTTAGTPSATLFIVGASNTWSVSNSGREISRDAVTNKVNWGSCCYGYQGP